LASRARSDAESCARRCLTTEARIRAGLWSGPFPSPIKTRRKSRLLPGTTGRRRTCPHRLLARTNWSRKQEGPARCCCLAGPSTPCPYIAPGVSARRPVGPNDPRAENLRQLFDTARWRSCR
jgi:hypothetical protein